MFFRAKILFGTIPHSSRVGQQLLQQARSWIEASQPGTYKAEKPNPEHPMSLRRFLKALIVSTLALTGCTAPRFSAVATIPRDKALVYIYRKAALGGIAGKSSYFCKWPTCYELI